MKFHIPKGHKMFLMFVVIILVVTVIYAILLHVSSDGLFSNGMKSRYLKRNLFPSKQGVSKNIRLVNYINNDSLLLPRELHKITPHDLNTLTDKNKQRLMSVFKTFETGLSADERHDMLFIFRTLVNVCFKNDLTFFLYGGSLLGSYRHHDVIPWDDDIDIMMNSSQKEIIYKTLSSINKGFEFYLSTASNVASKFFHKTSTFLANKPFRWPYVDIFFFQENTSHIFDEMPQYKADYIFPKTETFPLLRRPFAGHLLPVPFNTKFVLDKTYSPSICKRPSFSHKLESSKRQFGGAIPCKYLYGSHPFVFREQSVKKISQDGRDLCFQNETVKIGDKEIYTVAVETNLCKGRP